MQQGRTPPKLNQHLKYDNKLFRNLFVGPLSIAIVTCVGLLFLFGKVAIRMSSGQ